MAFTQETFVPLSAQANSDAPRMMAYSTADNAAATETASYFDGFFAASQCATGDVLLAVMSDATKMYKLTVDRDAETLAVSTGTAIA
jgi:hypothetical protein